MMRGVRFIPRPSRLRWKLAASATVATMAAILVVLTISEVGMALSRPDPPPPGQLAWALVRGLPGTALFLLPIGMIVGTLFGMASSRDLVRRFGRLSHVAAAWSRGELSLRVNDQSRDELGDLTRNLETMAGDLEQLLETRQELAAADERNRLARELHDTVKQQVFSVSLYLGSVASQIDRDRDTAVADLERARDLVRKAGRDLDRLILALCPAALEHQGLAEALYDLATRWSDKTRIDADVHVSGDCDLPLEVEQALYRVAQEALANVARHSGAGKVTLRLAVGNGTAPGEPKPVVRLEVRDDGAGFDTTTLPLVGLGLRGMRERMAVCGGTLEVESSAAGTRVAATCLARRLAE